MHLFPFHRFGKCSTPIHARIFSEAKYLRSAFSDALPSSRILSAVFDGEAQLSRSRVFSPLDSRRLRNSARCNLPFWLRFLVRAQVPFGDSANLVLCCCIRGPCDVHTTPRLKFRRARLLKLDPISTMSARSAPPSARPQSMAELSPEDYGHLEVLPSTLLLPRVPGPPALEQALRAVIDRSPSTFARPTPIMGVPRAVSAGLPWQITPDGALYPWKEATDLIRRAAAGRGGGLGRNWAGRVMRASGGAPLPPGPRPDPPRPVPPCSPSCPAGATPGSAPMVPPVLLSPALRKTPRWEDGVCKKYKFTA